MGAMRRMRRDAPDDMMGAMKPGGSEERRDMMNPPAF
jgi:hypothetical protein